MRVLLVAPPMIPIPPPTYAGTERVIAALGNELHRQGHDVALVAAGDSDVPYRLIPTVDRSLWRSGYDGDLASYLQVTVAAAWREAAAFDIVHCHLENHSFPFAQYAPVPVVTTLHGRLDVAGMPELLEAFPDVPLVSISESQRRWHPDLNWVGTIHHGLPLGDMPYADKPGDYLAFVGRATKEKGLPEAVELARRAGLRLRVAAKVHNAAERRYHQRFIEPEVDSGAIEFLGELGPAERDPLFAGALATVMLGAWPEPFGLVAIESMATGTPVVARRAGALTETIEHGVTGFLVDDVDEAILALDRVRELDRMQVRKIALERFSPRRMADDYVRVYQRVIEDANSPRLQRRIGSSPSRHRRGGVASTSDAAAEPAPLGARAGCRCSRATV
jgi:glycosyltransferase involved in cell wall biosynthesis